MTSSVNSCLAELFCYSVLCYICSPHGHLSRYVKTSYNYKNPGLPILAKKYCTENLNLYLKCQRKYKFSIKLLFQHRKVEAFIFLVLVISIQISSFKYFRGFSGELMWTVFIEVMSASSWSKRHWSQSSKIKFNKNNITIPVN